MNLRFPSLGLCAALLACSSSTNAPATSDASTDEDTGATVEDSASPLDSTTPDSSAPADSSLVDSATADAASEVAADSAADVSTKCTETGATESEDCGKCGKRARLCDSDGTWLPWGACTGEKGLCAPAETRMVKCGKCGMRTETCTATCGWEPGACTGEGLCNPGDTETQFGACATAKLVKTRTCSTTCAWSMWSECAAPKGWNDIAPAPITGRHYHTAVWTGTEMIVWGGQASGSSYASDGAAYNPNTDMWRTLPAPTIVGRYYHSAVWTGTQMIVWGGYGSLSPYYRADGASYDATNGWVTLAAAPIAARQQHTAVWTGTEMIIWGGRGSTSTGFADGAAYSPTTKEWRTIKASPLTARYDHAAVWAGGRMIVFGGRGSCGSYCAEAAAYDPATDNWTALTPPSADLDGRYNAAGLADPTGKLAAFWGGYGTYSSSAYYRNTGAIFEPATSMWKSITAPSETVLPYSRRWGMTTWWTPSGFFVWGGTGYNATGSSLTVATGAMFDPATSTWTAMSDTNALSARYHAPAVWTGSEAIVWGGYSYRNDGKIYRP